MVGAGECVITVLVCNACRFQTVVCEPMRVRHSLDLSRAERERDASKPVREYVLIRFKS